MLTTFLMTGAAPRIIIMAMNLGMTNPVFAKIEDFRDIATLNEYKHQKIRPTCKNYTRMEI